MKVALITGTTRTTNGTQDWTDANISSDFVAACFLTSNATANATSTANGMVGIGWTDAASSMAIAIGNQDATATASAVNSTVINNTKCLLVLGSSATTVSAASYNSTLSNGVRISYGVTDGVAHNMAAMLISGTDMGVKLSQANFGATDSTITVTHGGSAAPVAVMIMAMTGSTADPGNQSSNITIGFWDGSNSVGGTFGNQSLSATQTNVFGRYVGTDLGHICRDNTERATLTISNVTATTFDISTSAVQAGGTQVHIVSFFQLSNTASAKAAIGTTPTSTGNFNPASGLLVKPQILFTVSSRLTGTTFTTSDAAGSFGIGISVDNAGSTQQFSTAITAKDNVATTVAKSQSNTGAGMYTLDNTGAAAGTGAVNAWNSNGSVQMNASQAWPAAQEYLSFAIGIGSLAPGGRNQNGLTLFVG